MFLETEDGKAHVRACEESPDDTFLYAVLADRLEDRGEEPELVAALRYCFEHKRSPFIQTNGEFYWFRATWSRAAVFRHKRERDLSHWLPAEDLLPKVTSFTTVRTWLLSLQWLAESLARTPRPAASEVSTLN